MVRDFADATVEVAGTLVLAAVVMLLASAFVWAVASQIDRATRRRYGRNGGMILPDVRRGRFDVIRCGRCTAEFTHRDWQDRAYVTDLHGRRHTMHADCAARHADAFGR